jgi:hypothetical protein
MLWQCAGNNAPKIHICGCGNTRAHGAAVAASYFLMAENIRFG